jgi:hypothetical protein
MYPITICVLIAANAAALIAGSGKSILRCVAPAHLHLIGLT